MLRLHPEVTRLADRISRREMLRLGGLGALGLSLPTLLGTRTANATPRQTATSFGQAKSCIVLFLFGGPPQHSTWDPKPNAPANIRGEFAPIATNVPGIQLGEIMPRLARHADQLAILRAMSTRDNAHSASGYFMLTGRPHQPMQVENANPGPPNDWPTLGAMVQSFKPGSGLLPASIRLPHRIFNTDGSVWPGQDSGFLGRAADPWLFNCLPGASQFRIPEFSLDANTPGARLHERQTLLQQLNDQLRAFDTRGPGGNFTRQQQQAFDLLRSAQSAGAVQLERETAATRDRYGRGHFGQSVLLARRLVEAGVSLVQVNWYRGAEEPSDAPVWDTHVDEAQRLRTVLMPPMDQAFSALLEDLTQRGLLEETLVVCMAEFGRTPRFNGRAGRDHWGQVFSVALAGGGIRGGIVHGASDAHGAEPADGRVQPQDLTATILHCLGIPPASEFHDRLGRPVAACTGDVIRQILS